MPNIIRHLNEDYIHSLEENKLFEEYKSQKVVSKQHETLLVSKDKTVFKLIDKVHFDTATFVAGEYSIYHGKEYFEIKGTYSRVHGRGYLTYLFELLLYEFNLRIISDAQHTSPGSKEFWQSLVRKKKFNIFRYDIRTNYKRNASKFRDDQIWGLTQDESDELENMKQEFKEFEGINPLDVIDGNLFRTQDYSNDDLLDQFDVELENINPQVLEYQKFIESYKELIKSKENIRLIAQK